MNKAKMSTTQLNLLLPTSDVVETFKSETETETCPSETESETETYLAETETKPSETETWNPRPRRCTKYD